MKRDTFRSLMTTLRIVNLILVIALTSLATHDWCSGDKASCLFRACVAVLPLISVLYGLIDEGIRP